MLAVTNETIIRKMMKELNYVQHNDADNETMKKHIANVRLLCDLVLEEETTVDTDHITNEEMKAMIGKDSSNRVGKTQSIHRESIEHDDANGSSIFDF